MEIRKCTVEVSQFSAQESGDEEEVAHNPAREIERKIVENEVFILIFGSGFKEWCWLSKD